MRGSTAARLRWRTLAAALAVLGLAANAGAEPRPASDLSYAAPRTCPTESDFRAAVAALLQGEDTSTATTARKLVAAIVAEGAAYRGRLTVVDADGAKSAREISTRSCDQTMRTLAFLAAMAMGLHEAEEPPPTPLAPDVPSDTKVVKEERVDDARSLQWSVGASFETAFGITGSGAHPGAAVMLRASDARSRFVAPSVALGGLFIDGGTVQGPAGIRASEQLVAGTLEACPIRIALADSLAARPCAAFGAGVMLGSASGVTRGQAQALPWIAGMGVGRVDWDVTRHLQLGLHAGLSVLALQTRFYVGDAVTLYEPPTLGVICGLGIAVKLP